jgi:hypothetical protein
VCAINKNGTEIYDQSVNYFDTEIFKRAEKFLLAA